MFNIKIAKCSNNTYILEKIIYNIGKYLYKGDFYEIHYHIRSGNKV